MREILFRGKQLDNGEWVEGYLVVATGRINKGKHYILPSVSGISCAYDVNKIWLFGFVEVIPDTVGEYTGLTDMNGKKIFEGDIIYANNGEQSTISVVKFGEYFPKTFYEMLDVFYPGYKHIPAIGFHAITVNKHEEMILFQSPFVTVIGNIYDNPELLEADNGK